MQSVYYLVMLVGVLWLAAWSVTDLRRLGVPWSPFDMREAPPPAGELADRGEPASDGRRKSRHTNGVVGRGSAVARTADAAADIYDPVPERRAAQSWRVRREPVASSRRRRPSV